jgi:acyl-coenzyme A thioesterase PaaI-like protein
LTSEAPARPAASDAAQLAIDAVRARPTGIWVGGRRFELQPHHCFACGELNESGLQLRLHGDEHGCWTQLVIDDRFEGWQGIAHGGILATILDEVAAWSVIARGGWGVTARMAIQFKLPVPVGRAIRGEGWVTESRKRVFETAARVGDPGDGTVFATSTATFVAATGRQREELATRYGIELPGGVDQEPAPDAHRKSVR